MNRDPGTYMTWPMQEQLKKEKAKLVHPEYLWEIEDNFGDKSYVLARTIHQAIERFDEWAKHENNPSNIPVVCSCKLAHKYIICGASE